MTNTADRTECPGETERDGFRSDVTAELLRGSGIADSLSDDQLEVLASRAELKQYAAGEAIISLTDTSFPVLVLISGTAEVAGMFGDIVNLVQPGGVIGEISFLDRKRRSASVVAREACEVAVISEDVIAWLSSERVDIYMPLLQNLVKELCSKLRSAQRFIDTTDALTTRPEN